MDTVHVEMWVLIVAAVMGLALLANIFVTCFVMFKTDAILAHVWDKARLDYEVIPVPPSQVDEFRKANPLIPLWEDFLKAMLNTSRYSGWHERVCEDQLRYAAEYAGMTLFVKVKQMPEAKR